MRKKGDAVWQKLAEILYSAPSSGQHISIFEFDDGMHFSSKFPGFTFQASSLSVCGEDEIISEYRFWFNPTSFCDCSALLSLLLLFTFSFPFWLLLCLIRANDWDNGMQCDADVMMVWNCYLRLLCICHCAQIKQFNLSNEIDTHCSFIRWFRWFRWCS